MTGGHYVLTITNRLTVAPYNTDKKYPSIFCSIIQIVTLNKLQLETVTFLDQQEKTTSYSESFQKEILHLRQCLMA